MTAVDARTTDMPEETTISVEYDFGENLEEMTELFTKEVVYSQARQNMVIAAQSYIRGKVRSAQTANEKEGRDPNDIDWDALQEQVQEEINGWKPGIKQMNTKSKEEKAREALDKLPPEVRAEILRSMLAQQEESAA